MDNLDTTKRNELIGQFVLVSMPKVAAEEIPAEEIERALSRLIYDFGHDPEAHAVIIRGLDDISEKRPEKARRLTLHAVTDANVRHGWGETAEEVAARESRAVLESKLALMWKHMLVNASDLSYAQKTLEAQTVARTMYMSSKVLTTEAQAAVQHLRDNPVYAAQPW